MKYDFDKMGGIWADQAREITEKGERFRTATRKQA